MAPSISRRIVISLAVTTVLAAICEYGWLYLKARSTAASLRERTLLEQAKDISAFLVIDSNGNPDLTLPARLAEAYNNSASTYHYTVRDGRGTLIFTSGPSVSPLPVFKGHPHAMYHYDPDGSGPLQTFGAAVKATVGDRTFITQVEQTTAESQFLSASVMEEFLTDGGWLQFPFLAALLGVSVVVVKRSLRPLIRISSIAESIDPKKVGVRLPTANVPQEVSPLVKAINSALERLDNGLIHQREFNANAAHQLRTPLAVLTANIDAMPDQQTASKLRLDVELMSRIVSQLLLVARLDTDLAAGDQTVELNGLATEVAANLAPLAISSGKHLEVIHSPGDVLVRGTNHALSAALSNLIENAISHTSTGTKVTVRVTDAPAIEVIDTGQGIPVEAREKIFERFWKGDRQGHGAGLGLAIVSRIMTGAGGSISVADAPGGGAAFTLAFRTDSYFELATSNAR
ncbi:sensor histidine kinase [Rhodoplanes sp. Z2-YC6860]|uniref:sensor histidine kinase n=1 Tax=Rhodoplanes sp. Z2-YC6860 TaxID=674703 RepID=UPI00078CB23A|nr:HAMP domain-containing sensor histidine kinase [Rhodoplanes sp. Z2-YC6860]AMN38493.1 Two-component sensor histidine kinase [Rhodoplanes sp. Z2-YC6860]